MVIAEIRGDETPAHVLAEIVKRLEAGEVLLLPTDTVYGLHACAGNQKAIERVREIKQLADPQPFTAIAPTIVDIGKWVQLPEGRDKRIVLDSWPGAVTWILPAREAAPDYLQNSDGELGIRIPNFPLLRAATIVMNDLIISTSANIHGKPAPKSREEIDPAILDAVDGAVFCLDPLAGRPSEVKRWTPSGPELIRARNLEQSSPSERLNLLFVCTGNICRSPMAAAIFQKKLKAASPDKFEIRSAGTRTQDGLRATLPAVEAMREHDYNLGGHESTLLSNTKLDWADIVFVLNRDHLSEVHSAFPEFSEKVYMMTTYPEPGSSFDQGIEDPYGLDLETYRRTRDELEAESDRILPHLLKRIHKG